VTSRLFGCQFGSGGAVASVVLDTEVDKLGERFRQGKVFQGPFHLGSKLILEHVSLRAIVPVEITPCPGNAAK
jgi:hypothetical protein